MTDARRRSQAVELLGRIAVGPLASAEFYVQVVMEAMADAERRGMERERDEATLRHSKTIAMFAQLQATLTYTTTERDVLSNSRNALVEIVKDLREQLATAQGQLTESEQAAYDVAGTIERLKIIALALEDAGRADEEAKRLRDCLVEVNRVLQDPETCGIVDTIWYNDLITLVEFVDGVLDENPDQQQLPIAQARADKEER